jgi:hypothetical protein
VSWLCTGGNPPAPCLPRAGPHQVKPVVAAGSGKWDCVDCRNRHMSV